MIEDLLLFLDYGVVIVGVVVILIIILIVVIEIVLVILVFIVEVDLERRDARHFQAGAAIVTTQSILEIDILRLEIERGIAFRTGGHTKILRRLSGVRYTLPARADRAAPDGVTGTPGRGL